MITMPDRAVGTTPIVKLDGTRLDAAAEASLLAVTVDSDLAAPGSCLLTFADPARTLLDDLGIDFLQPLEVLASAVEEDDAEAIFLGEIYGFDFLDDETGTFALVRAYDAAYRLKQHRQTTTFNEVTDADVVRELAGARGVETGRIEATEVTHPYLAQINQTDWDFLQARAQASHCVLRVQDGVLSFEQSPEAAGAPEPGDHASTGPLQLTAGRNLLYLRARTTASQGVEQVEVRGWDPVRKEAVVSATPAISSGAELETSAAEVAAQHGNPTHVAATPTLASEASSAPVAASLADRAAASFAFVEGRALGDPRLRAGVAVSLGRSGRFDGKYTISSARHVFDQAGYHTTFTVSGGHDRSLYGLASAAPSTPAQRFEGVYPAVVTNVTDPTEAGRVKIKLPWLDELYESDWARVTQLGAGPDRGVLWFPEVGDEVLVAFLGGAPSHPVIIGGLYNGVDAPPFEGFVDPSDGAIDTRGLKTRIGHTLVFSDAGGEESIRVETGDGSASITLDQAGRAIRIDTRGDIEISAQGSIRLKAGRDLMLDAAGQGTVRASQGLRLESSGEVSVSGAIIRLN